MQELTSEQVKNLATAVRLFFSCEHFEIEAILELTYSYCLRKNLISDKSEEWVSQLIDNMNGGGYSDPEMCYYDLLTMNQQ